MRGRDLLRLDGEVVRLARIERQLTREELAAAARCSMSTVRLAHAGVPISLTKARDLAKALRVSLASLCGGSVVKAHVKRRSEAVA